MLAANIKHERNVSHYVILMNTPFCMIVFVHCIRLAFSCSLHILFSMFAGNFLSSPVPCLLAFDFF